MNPAQKPAWLTWDLTWGKGITWLKDFGGYTPLISFFGEYGGLNPHFHELMPSIGCIGPLPHILAG